METIKDKKENVIAIIIPKNFSSKGTNFFTQDDSPLQIAQIQRGKGEVIKAHTHKPVNITINKTQEAIFIKKGSVKVDLYGEDKALVVSKILFAGDVILLAAGGHGFEVLEELEMIEVKQGPYMGDDYKIIY